MAKKIYWKDVGSAFFSSKGRFFSIFNLMMIGSMALIGLKVTSPNMQQTAQAYIEQTNGMDLAVMSDMGLSNEDQKELDGIEGAHVEYGYLKDVTLDKTGQAVRLFSESQSISLPQLLSGRLPSNQQEIALSQSLSSDYQIGDQIQFLESDKSSKVLRETSFRVTGFVASSDIWGQLIMGASSAGSGQLAAYGYVEPSVFDSPVYMIARIRYDDLAGLPYYQSAYKDRLSAHQKELDDLLADNGNQRLKQIKAEAQTEIKEGQSEIEQAQIELADGQGQLQSSQADLKEAQNSLAQAQLQLAQKWAELEEVQAQLALNKEKLDQTKAELDRRKQQLEETKSFFALTQSELDGIANQLAQAKSQLEETNRALSQEGAALSAAQAKWYQAQQALNHDIENRLVAGETLADHPDLLAAQEDLDREKAGLDQAMVTYQQAHEAYQASYGLYEQKERSYQKGLADYQVGYAQYQKGLTDYELGYARYQEGLVAYQEGLARSQQGEQELQSAQEELTRQGNQLQAANRQLEQAQTDFDEKKGQAEQEIAQAKDELSQAQSDLSQLAIPSYQTYTRSSLPGGEGFTTYDNATDSVSAVGNVFPLVLYLVAALVTFTTMTRFVDEERTKAGLLKALGYTDRQIIAKFVLYGLGSALAGTVVGIVAGNFLLSPMISSVISSSTVIGRVQLYFYPFWTVMALVLALISAVLPAYLVARKELLEKPAYLLLPKPPVAGSSILLEKLPFIWERLSFAHKVTARNIFRYKKRMFMTIFGVAGTVALLFGGLGIHSSISGVVDTQFGDIIHYDMIVVENSRAAQEDQQELEEALALEQVATKQPVVFESLDAEEVGVTLNLLASNQSDIGGLLSLRQAGKGQTIELPEKGAILTEKIAQLYDVTVGDAISLTIAGKTVQVEIAGIAEMYAGHFIYLSSDYYEVLTNQPYQTNAYLLQLRNRSSEKIEKLASQLFALKGVAALVQNTSLISMLETVAESLQSIMVILIVLSTLLGLVILYNLTIINVAERIRELSTIKVLGFHHQEVTLYIYRETIVLSLVGMLLGLGGGVLLHRVLLQIIGSVNMMFKPEVTIGVYLIPILAIIVILALLGWYVNRKLRKVDMLEALKSVD